MTAIQALPDTAAGTFFGKGPCGEAGGEVRGRVRKGIRDSLRMMFDPTNK